MQSNILYVLSNTCNRFQSSSISNSQSLRTQTKGLKSTKFLNNEKLN